MNTELKMMKPPHKYKETESADYAEEKVFSLKMFKLHVLNTSSTLLGYVLSFHFYHIFLLIELKSETNSLVGKTSQLVEPINLKTIQWS